MSNLKARLERLEQKKGAETDDIPMTAGFDRFGPTDTIEQRLFAKEKIKAE